MLIINQGGNLLKVYYDPNFTFQELLDYYAPLIVDINDEKFIDLHSLNIVNLLGLQPVRRYHEELNGWLFNVNEYETNELLPLENLITFNAENFEKFKISNALSLEHLKYNEIYNNSFLKVENTLNNLECVISLNSNFLTKNLEIFADKEFEFLLEIYVALSIKRLVSKHSLNSSFNHPCIFRIELFNSSYVQVYKLLEEFRNFNLKFSEQISKLYDEFKRQPKSPELERLLQNTLLDDFTRTIYNYGNIILLIEDLKKLDELTSLFNKST